MTTHVLSYGAQTENLTLAGTFSFDPATTTGLTFGHTDGYIITGTGSGRAVVAAGTLTLTDDATNWIYENGSVLAVNSGAAPTLARILYKITTASGVITAIIDYRGAIVTDKTSF